VDPTGHIFGVDDLIIAVVIGAALGAASSAARGGNILQGMAMGALGGLCGGLGAWAGSAIGPAWGWQFAGSIVGGAVGGAANSAIMHGNVGLGALTGAIGGAISYGVSALNHELIGNYVENLKELGIGAGVAAAGGAAGGATASAIEGGNVAEGALLGGATGGGGFALLGTPDLIRNQPGQNSGFRVTGGTDADRARADQALADLSQNKDSAEVVRVMKARGVEINIDPNLQNGSYYNGRVTWNPYFHIQANSGTTITPTAVLGHELNHALAPNLGSVLHTIRFGRYNNLEEYRVIAGWERSYLMRQGLAPRTDHGAASWWIER